MRREREKALSALLRLNVCRFNIYYRIGEQFSMWGPLTPPIPFEEGGAVGEVGTIFVTVLLHDLPFSDVGKARWGGMLKVCKCYLKLSKINQRLLNLHP